MIYFEKTQICSKITLRKFYHSRPLLITDLIDCLLQMPKIKMSIILRLPIEKRDERDI